MSARFLTEREVAALLRLSPRTLQRLRAEGGGPPFVRIGARRVVYPEDGTLAWVAGATFPHRAAELAARREPSGQ